MIRLCALIFLAFGLSARAQDDPAYRGLPSETLFDMPEISARLAQALQAQTRGNLPYARQQLGRLTASYPDLGLLHVADAMLEAVAGDRAEAFDALEAALATGQAGLGALLGAPGFASLAEDPAFTGLRDQLAGLPPRAPVRPALIAGGTAPVDATNTAWDPRTQRLTALFEPLADRPDLPILDPGRSDPAATLLRSLHARGQAAGNWGDLYDNRDRGHSQFAPQAAPQMTHLTFAAEADLYGQGLPGPMTFNRPVIGNASLAITGGPLPRSLPRQMMTGGEAARFVGDLSANRLLVYPEHRDHDPQTGDRYPANVPAWLISQGSSGSDMLFVEALAMTLAAFRPDTKEVLIRDGLIAPTLQMILRRTYGARPTAQGYLTGAAHPTVFDGAKLNPARMISLANAIKPDDIPPLVRLNVEEDLTARSGIDYLDEEASEDLFTTPSAIARIWRAYAWEREMVLSAAGTRDPNGHDLEITWTLLRGDPDRVTITPLEGGTKARIRLNWHDPYALPGGMETHRIDIAVIADNGAHKSAPAILSVAFPPNETRVWEEGPKGPRLKEIAYMPDPGAYADPALFATAPWRDVMAYAPDGTLTGWTRIGPDGSQTQITLAGGALTGPDGPVAHRRAEGAVLRQTTR